ncbi:MAG: RodZ domain-containing protein [Bryobacteraceae bacterium]|jgi:cytoskeletal protein RodZ
MLSVGETLRRARLEQGLDLCTVAAQTKISARYLEAIESDDRKRLPSGFFYKSFVEQYAKSLSLDTREIDAEIDRVLSADDPLPLPGFESVVARNVPPMTFRHRFHTRRVFTSTASLLLVLAACSGVYAWWHDARGVQGHVQVWLNSVRSFAKPKTVVASAKAYKLAPKPVTKSAPPPATPPQPAATVEAVPVSLASDTKPDEVDESTIASEGSTSDYKVMLDLMAHEATWLSVSSDGKPVFSGILQANQTKSVGGKQFAKMRVGNAAGIEVRLNGKLLGPLGARGQVLIVLFTPDNFQIVSPPKESD